MSKIIITIETEESPKKSTVLVNPTGEANLDDSFGMLHSIVQGYLVKNYSAEDAMEEIRKVLIGEDV